MSAPRLLVVWTVLCLALALTGCPPPDYALRVKARTVESRVRLLKAELEEARLERELEEARGPCANCRRGAGE